MRSLLLLCRSLSSRRKPLRLDIVELFLSSRHGLRQVAIENLKLDLKTFNKKRGDSDVPTHFYYVDNEQGLVVDLNGDGAKDIVSALIYQPAAKYKHLRCPEEVIPSSE